MDLSLQSSLRAHWEISGANSAVLWMEQVRLISFQLRIKLGITLSNQALKNYICILCNSCPDKCQRPRLTSLTLMFPTSSLPTKITLQAKIAKVTPASSTNISWGTLHDHQSNSHLVKLFSKLRSFIQLSLHYVCRTTTKVKLDLKL